MQLRRRLESVKRIHKAADTLEDRIGELEQMQGDVFRQVSELAQLTQHISDVLEQAEVGEDVALAA
jgi:hypothetical protein